MRPSDEERMGGAAHAERLHRAVQELNQSVRDLAARSTRTESDLRASRRAIRLTAVGLALDLTLTVVAFFLYHNQQVTGRQLAMTVVEQERTRSEALCPLYGLFLGSYDPHSEAAKRNPARYDDAFVVIRKGAHSLGCPEVPDK